MQANQVDRAKLTWSILIERASKRETITYGELGDKLGIHHRVVGHTLNLIQNYCLGNSYPPLSILVVNQSGKPGEGFIAYDSEKLHEGNELVWTFNWSNVKNPFHIPENSKEWSDAELKAAIDAYLEMLFLESHGKPYSKTEVNRTLRAGPLSGRSKASIEYRMQNISASLEELCLPRIAGYLPAKNVGEGVKDRICAILATRAIFDKTDYQPVADEKELALKVAKLQRLSLSGSPRGIKTPQRTSCSTTVFLRDPLVKAWVLQNARGKCEGCDSGAPFELDDGSPFLEVHHVRPLADGGSDQISNVVALCPNCHRRCHLSRDRKQFTESLYERVNRLNTE